MPRRYYSIRMRASKDGIHISGAEGIYEYRYILDIVKRYTERAFLHEKGRAEEIRLTIEELKEKPEMIPSLPLCTINTKTPEMCKKIATKILSSIGITERAIDEAFNAITVGVAMRGAMLMNIEGVRLEPDLLRGVRVTRMGITQSAMNALSRRLSRFGLNNTTVKEALILASKVHRHPMILGELCISDDPNYTTGYVATRRYGYIRLPHIKKRGSQYGGRVFFITGGEVNTLIKYLQTSPILINRVAPCKGVVSIKDIIEGKSHH
ncbi:MAG: 6-carboxyhexanoate--CoA ligase [bacterium JZ-2024 1]